MKMPTLRKCPRRKNDNAGEMEARQRRGVCSDGHPEGLMMVAQMRGWSYLTGDLNLSSEEAVKVQKGNARLITEAPEMYEIVRGVAYGSCEECVPLMVRAREILARIDEEM